MNIAKRVLVLSAMALALVGEATTVTDYYKLSMSACVPRTYDNMQSLGYRAYQNQNIKGDLLITYDLEDASVHPIIEVVNLVNYTHKINGERISYDCFVDDDMVYSRVNLIGSNKTGIFKTPSIVFYLDAEPSYSIGEDDEDNSLLITISGRGTTKKDGKGRYINSFSGRFAGTLGCGCKAYGHISPTRVAAPCGPSDEVDDVASVWGSWKASFKYRKINK